MPKLSKIPLNHDKKLSCNMGEVIPLTCYDVLPGDIIRQETDVMIRTQPLVTPVMHDVYAEVFHIFVPNRIIWDEWEDFITGGELGTANPVHPYITSPASTGFLVGSLPDYLNTHKPGVPDDSRNALPIRAYQSSFNYLFRDSQLVTPAAISKASGNDTTTSRDLQMAMWQKDRYTTARPQPQLGAPVAIPLTGDAPVLGLGTANNGTYGATNVTTRESDGTTSVYATAKQTNVASANDVLYVEQNGTTGYPNIFADLSSVDAVDINDLRQAGAFQRFLENLNNFGARYSERIQQAFGVPVQDSRLSEPELIATGTSRFQFSEVLQTAEGTDPVGEMKGHGITVQRSNRFKYRAMEHGWFLTLMVVRPKTQYQDAVHRMMNRPTRLDYFNPEFANLGDMPIFNKEIQPSHASPDGVFGYAPAWDEYRFIPSSVAGEFRDTLDDWHMARQLPNDVALNATFVRANPTTRVFSDTNSDQLYVTARHHLTMLRKIPKYPKPRLM